MSIAFRTLTIDAPPFKPSAYGLLAVATVREDAGLQPMAGGTFLSAAAGNATSNVIDRTDCVPPMGGMAAKAINFAEAWVNALPLVAYGEWRCSPASVDYGEAQRQASTLFLSGESREIESAVWTYWKTLGACTTKTTLPLALAAAEQKIATDYGGEGAVHMTRETATVLAPYFERQGSTLRTIAGYTPVVVGDGYGDINMIFATGPIVVTRGPLENLTPTPSAAIGRNTNDLYGMVERSYLVAVDNPIACFTP